MNEKEYNLALSEHLAKKIIESFPILYNRTSLRVVETIILKQMEFFKSEFNSPYFNEGNHEL